MAGRSKSLRDFGQVVNPEIVQRAGLIVQIAGWNMMSFAHQDGNLADGHRDVLW